VLLLEAGPICKDKPCGDAFVPQAVEILREYGASDSVMAQLGGCRFVSVSAIHRNGTNTKHPITPGSGWVVRRAMFDRWFRQIAARVCSLRTDTRVEQIKPHGRRLCLSARTNNSVCQFEVETVIVATGSATGLISQCELGGQARKGVAISQYSSTHRLDQSLLFHFTKSLSPGYSWWFPTGPCSANIGAWAPTIQSAKSLPSFRDGLARLRSGGLLAPTRAAPVRLWSGQGKVWHA
jgi:flavin-dependent dehydrogenase